MHIWLPMTGLLSLLAIQAPGCAPDMPPPDANAVNLPLLEADLTIGTTFYGGAELPPADSPERALLDEAVTRGFSGFTYYVDWSDLEPTPRDYRLETFTETLDDLQELGVTPMVNITVGDIEDYNLPDPLSDDRGGLADGVTLDDPDVIERFGKLLDRVVPILLARGGFFLGVGNEVDARFDEDFPDELNAYVRFTKAACDRVHAIEPRLAVGVTLTKNAIVGRTRTFRELRAVTDIIPFNYAPIRPDFIVEPLDEIRYDFRAAMDAYGDGPIMIQELTCPSAESMQASEQWQRGCFERLLDEIDATEQVRFASIFTFQDFDESTCSAVRDALFGSELDDLPPDLAQRLADYLCQLGIVRPDATPKPAWPSILQALVGK